MSGLSPESSAIRMTPELEARVASATSAEEIKNIMAAAALEQHLVERDALNPSVFHETALAANAPKQFAKVININGKQIVLQAPDELSLAKEENALYRKLFEPTEDTTTEQARDSNTGRFVSKADAEAEQARLVANAELDGKFKRGEIDTETYLIESGALDRALAQKETHEKDFVQSWEKATAEFVSRHPDWQGGDANRDVLGNLIIERGMVDMNPLEALEKAYAIAQEEGRLVDNPEVTQWKKIAEAKTPEELKEILGYRGTPRESGMWGL